MNIGMVQSWFPRLLSILDHCCLQGQLCDHRLWFWQSRNLIGIRMNYDVKSCVTWKLFTDSIILWITIQTQIWNFPDGTKMCNTKCVTSMVISNKKSCLTKQLLTTASTDSCLSCSSCCASVGTCDALALSCRRLVCTDSTRFACGSCSILSGCACSNNCQETSISFSCIDINV